MTDSFPVLITFVLTRDELRRRGKRGGEIAHSRHPDGSAFTAPARTAFNQRFADESERRRYYADLAKKSHAARRARQGGES